MSGFVSKLSRIMNTGQSRAVLLTGNIYDLFWNGENYVPLIQQLCKKYDIPASDRSKGITFITYEINDEIVIHGDASELVKCWSTFRGGGEDSSLDKLCQRAKGNPTFALELLRLLTECARRAKGSLRHNLLIVIEGADMLMPSGELSRMQVADRRRVSIVHDWFSDPEFMNGNNSVVLLSESRSLVHDRVSKLPQMLEVEVPSPDFENRRLFIERCSTKPEKMPNDLPELTAGLSLHALRQLLCQEEITRLDVVNKVEEFIKSQIGEDTVEFKKPSHTLEDVRGFTIIKTYMKDKVIPRFLAGSKKALPGAAFSGPIGGGKTFLGEAVAAELGIPVLVLKNLRSKWFGETDVIFERLRRTLIALDKVMIFVDEADTQFGNVSSEGHSTERRLTGGIQSMMSDTRLLGKVMWLLMTARIHLLSADIRRPGRVGSLIVPILDPEGNDKKDFIDWMLEGIDVDDEHFKLIEDATKGFSAAAYATAKREIASSKEQNAETALLVLEDIIPPNIGAERRYQTLQALLNCTRRQLLPEAFRGDLEQSQETWRAEIAELERKGIH